MKKYLEYSSTLFYGFNSTLKIRSGYKLDCIKKFCKQNQGEERSGTDC